MKVKIEWEEIKVDSKVRVKNANKEKWKNRHFAYYAEDEERQFMCWINGFTSWSSPYQVKSSWKFCELDNSEIKAQIDIIKEEEEEIKKSVDAKKVKKEVKADAIN